MNTQPKGLTWDEIKEKLSDMGKNLIVGLEDKGKYFPVSSFSVSVPNKYYDPEGFSEELEKKVSPASYRTIESLKLYGYIIEGEFFDKWYENHMKKEPTTTLRNIFIGYAMERKTENGPVRDFNTENVLESLAKIKDVYGEIYDIL